MNCSTVRNKSSLAQSVINQHHSLTTLTIRNPFEMCLCFSRRRKTVENFSSLSRKCFRWVNNQTLCSLAQIHKAHRSVCVCVCVWLIKVQLALWSRFLERHSLPYPCVSDPHRHVSVLSYNTHTHTH